MSEPDKVSKPITKETKPAAPATVPVAAKKDNTKTIVIVVGVLVLIFVVIPIILFIVLAGVVGHKIVGGVKVSNDGKTATIKTANGDQISTGSQTLPKDWPTSVPVYKGTLVNSSRLTIDGKITYSAVVETKDSSTTVGTTLSNDFSTNGWMAALDNKTSDGGLIASDNTTASLHTQVVYVTKDGKTTISYNVVPATASESQ
jgi:hypothetical protein